jgi:hypothetical protein
MVSVSLDRKPRRVGIVSYPICPTGKSLAIPEISYPALRAKIFRFRRRANQWFDSARLTQERGGSRSSRTLWWDAVDAGAMTDERGSSGRRSRVVLLSSALFGTHEMRETLARQALMKFIPTKKKVHPNRAGPDRT